MTISIDRLYTLHADLHEKMADAEWKAIAFSWDEATVMQNQARRKALLEALELVTDILNEARQEISREEEVTI